MKKNSGTFSSRVTLINSMYQNITVKEKEAYLFHKLVLLSHTSYTSKSFLCLIISERKQGLPKFRP